MQTTLKKTSSSHIQGNKEFTACPVTLQNVGLSVHKQDKLHSSCIRSMHFATVNNCYNPAPTHFLPESYDMFQDKHSQTGWNNNDYYRASLAVLFIISLQLSVRFCVLLLAEGLWQTTCWMRYARTSGMFSYKLFCSVRFLCFFYQFCDTILTDLPPLPSNRHHRSNGDCLERKRENYQVCSVQYCVQQYAHTCEQT